MTFTAAITIIITKFEMRVTVKSCMSSLLFSTEEDSCLFCAAVSAGLPGTGRRAGKREDENVSVF